MRHGNFLYLYSLAVFGVMPDILSVSSSFYADIRLPQHLQLPLQFILKVPDFKNKDESPLKQVTLKVLSSLFLRSPR